MSRTEYKVWLAKKLHTRPEQGKLLINKAREQPAKTRKQRGRTSGVQRY